MLGLSIGARIARRSPSPAKALSCQRLAFAVIQGYSVLTCLKNCIGHHPAEPGGCGRCRRRHMRRAGRHGCAFPSFTPNQQSSASLPRQRQCSAVVRLPADKGWRDTSRWPQAWSFRFRLGLAVLPPVDHHRSQISRLGYGSDHTGHQQLATPRLRADHRRQ
jgi:hypothetical protein